MRTLLFQFIFIAFSFIVIWFVIQKKNTGVLSMRAAAFWVLLWFAADAAVLFPELTTRIANRFGIGRGSDFVLYISIAIMFFLLLRLHLKIEMMQRDVTTVVRREAFQEMPERPKKQERLAF